MTARKSKKPIILLVLGFVLSLFLMYWIMRKFRLNDLWSIVSQVSLGILSLSLITKFFSFTFMSLRSRVLLQPLHPFKVHELFRSILIGFVGNNVMPFRLGELLRVHYLARTGNCPHTACLANVAIERLFDMLNLLIVFAFVAPLLAFSLDDLHLVFWLGGILIGACFFLWLVAKVPELFLSIISNITGFFGKTVGGFVLQKAQVFVNGLQGIASFQRILTAFFFTTCSFACSFGTIYVWFWAFGLSLPWYSPAVVAVFLAFGTILPSTPGHIGTYHYFMIKALTYLGVAEKMATSFALTAHAVAIIPFTILGLPIVLHDLFRSFASIREQEEIAAQRSTESTNRVEEALETQPKQV